MYDEEDYEEINIEGIPGCCMGGMIFNLDQHSHEPWKSPRTVKDLRKGVTRLLMGNPEEPYSYGCDSSFLIAVTNSYQRVARKGLKELGFEIVARPMASFGENSKLTVWYLDVSKFKRTHKRGDYE